MKGCSCVFSIFGATGDLTKRKLLPAFYFMEQEGQLKDNFRIVCISRKEKSQEQYKKEAAEAIRNFSRIKVTEDILQKLLKRINYYRLEFSDESGYDYLKDYLENVSG